MPLSSVSSCPQEDIRNILLEQIKKGDICILSSKFDDNPYIIRFEFPSIEEQLKYIQNYSFKEELFLYPSSSYLKKIEIYQT